MGRTAICIISVLFLSISSVLSLKCYSCHTDEPEETDCVEDFMGQTANCTDDQLACYVYHTEYNNGVAANFGRDCINLGECANACGPLHWVDQIFVNGDTGCNECCFTDFCNTGSHSDKLKPSLLVPSIGAMFAVIYHMF